MARLAAFEPKLPVSLTVVFVGAGLTREHGRSPCQATPFHGPASSRGKPAPTESLPATPAASGRQLLFVKYDSLRRQPCSDSGHPAMEVQVAPLLVSLPPAVARSTPQA
ncbi:hypothetical protein EI693_10335 [Pseudomonas oryziphila]|uniref:Uncharacterized protein n=1 Tax=Pseudomonas oryziphila TaxID=2894079 RepID=A0ABN5TGK4_9PSED|nr:hypothetical protein EI693_10335 [Pseudomonas oryziphila]